MSRRRPNTGGLGPAPRGVRGDLGKFYDTRYRPLAALDVDCAACQQRVVRLFCDRRPEKMTDVGYENQKRIRGWFGEHDDPKALRFACPCGAGPVVHMLAAVGRLMELVDTGKRTGRMSSST